MKENLSVDDVIELSDDSEDSVSSASESSSAVFAIVDDGSGRRRQLRAENAVTCKNRPPKRRLSKDGGSDENCNADYHRRKGRRSSLGCVISSSSRSSGKIDQADGPQFSKYRSGDVENKDTSAGNESVIGGDVETSKSNSGVSCQLNARVDSSHDGGSSGNSSEKGKFGFVDILQSLDKPLAEFHGLWETVMSFMTQDGVADNVSGNA
eukprot:GHVQ01012967.1.p1 GENE.GHVQ01012967.1~~GHVQ01012967.1.p1  ORF type:complete len:209 (-),score=36.58 GHVQ01012967.1:68-694(-)